jgi:superfamily II DNA/RNA helicase
MVCLGNRESNEETTWNPLRLIGMGVQIVLGTPASIWNAIDRRALRTEDIDTFVLEQAHELLCEGYRYEIHEVIKHLRRNAQIVMISGTIPPLSAYVDELICKFMRFPMSASFSRSFPSSAASGREVEYSLGGVQDDNDDCGSSEQQQQEETAADAADGSNNTEVTTATTFECHEQVRFMDSGWSFCKSGER